MAKNIITLITAFVFAFECTGAGDLSCSGSVQDSCLRPVSTAAVQTQAAKNVRIFHISELTDEQHTRLARLLIREEVISGEPQARRRTITRKGKDIPETGAFSAFIGDEPVGFVYYTILAQSLRETSEYDAVLEGGFYLAPGHTNDYGIAESLLRHAEEYFRKKGLRSYQVLIPATPDTQWFWKRFILTENQILDDTGRIKKAIIPLAQAGGDGPAARSSSAGIALTDNEYWMVASAIIVGAALLKKVGGIIIRRRQRRKFLEERGIRYLIDKPIRFDDALLAEEKERLAASYSWKDIEEAIVQFIRSHKKPAVPLVILLNAYGHRVPIRKSFAHTKEIMSDEEALRKACVSIYASIIAGRNLWNTTHEPQYRPYLNKGYLLYNGGTRDVDFKWFGPLLRARRCGVLVIELTSDIGDAMPSPRPSSAGVSSKETWTDSVEYAGGFVREAITRERDGGFVSRIFYDERNKPILDIRPDRFRHFRGEAAIYLQVNRRNFSMIFPEIAGSQRPEVIEKFLKALDEINRKKKTIFLSGDPREEAKDAGEALRKAGFSPEMIMHDSRTEYGVHFYNRIILGGLPLIIDTTADRFEDFNLGCVVLPEAKVTAAMPFYANPALASLEHALSAENPQGDKAPVMPHLADPAPVPLTRRNNWIAVDSSA